MIIPVVELDEMWTFVGKMKSGFGWLWRLIFRKVIGYAVGDGSVNSLLATKSNISYFTLIAGMLTT